MMHTKSIHASWLPYLAEEFNQPYMQELASFLENERVSGKTIYPSEEHIFEAFKTPFDKVEVVILGQDPYHGPGQAHGLAFSVLPGIKTPPSLVNIYKELESDIGIKVPSHGHLKEWAQRGVLLLNNVLTVENGQAGSHHKKGWEIFSDRVIQILNDKKENLVFILWGAPSQKKASIVDEKKHFVIKSPHPSPLSSYRGFFGSKPFSQTNSYLKSKNLKEIDWNICEKF